MLLLPFPPLQDYWEWVYQGALIEQIISHGAENSPFVLRDYPVPNAFSQALIAALSVIASPVVAAKLVILGYIALTAVAYRSLSRIAAPGQAGLAMLVLFSLMIGSQFFNGYINNVYGNLFLVIFFAGLLREKPSLLQTLLFSVSPSKKEEVRPRSKVRATWTLTIVRGSKRRRNQHGRRSRHNS